MTRRWLLLIALLVAAPAGAHTRSESYSSLMIDGTTVHLDFSLADLEARRLGTDGAALSNSSAAALPDQDGLRELA